MRQIHNIRQIVDWRLCLGCGACAYICPHQHIRLTDFAEEGIRPVVDLEQCISCSDCLEVCPAYDNDHSEINRRPLIDPALAEYCGPVLEIWEGHATDYEVRFKGASGGVLTALALYCMEKEGMHGTLHIGMNSEDATRNQTRMSRSRSELMDNAGSRYAPASACDSLGLIESAPAPCVFIGQPSEVTALRKAARLRPALGINLGLALSFFCAGSPARKGTLDLLAEMGIKPDEVASLRYRGNGWPGMFAPTLKDLNRVAPQMSYRDSWNFVQGYRPFSTNLSPDGTGEDADISCGDPWYREIPADEPGLSLVIVRTEKGRKVLKGAMDAGVVSLNKAEAWKLINSQKNLIAKRGAVAGRVASLIAMGLPAPRLRGFSLFKNWRRLDFRDKLRSTLGTVRRAVTRGYFNPLRLKEL
jgi:coenzyme F420 hydrogenase subunit beta